MRSVVNSQGEVIGHFDDGGDSDLEIKYKILKSSLEINELFDAIQLAQGEFPVIPKDKEVKVFSKPPRQLLYTYMYADLTSIISSVRPALTKSGLGFTQNYEKDPTLGFGIYTVLLHKSGQWLKTGFVPCSIGGMDMKQVAGQFTYAKRISLTAALGISADEDVDAASIESNSGNSTTQSNVNSKVKKDPNGATIVNPQLQINAQLWKEFNSLGASKGWNLVELTNAIEMLYGIKNPKMMTRGNWFDFTKLLRDKDKNEISIMLVEKKSNEEMGNQS